MTEEINTLEEPKTIPEKKWKIKAKTLANIVRAHHGSFLLGTLFGIALSLYFSILRISIYY